MIEISKIINNINLRINKIIVRSIPKKKVVNNYRDRAFKTRIYITHVRVIFFLNTKHNFNRNYFSL